MKTAIFLLLFIPFIGKAQFKIVNTATIPLLELRQGGTWPITLQRVTKASDTAYELVFRNQEYTNEIIMKNFRFRNLEQLKYFQKGLSSLKSGSTGDVAEFAEFTIKRIDIKKEGVWYTFDTGKGLTNFQQPEADKIIAAIQSL